MIRVLYFAWVRERIGLASEDVEASPACVLELVEILRGQSSDHALALADLSALRVALDQDLAAFEDSLEGVKEVAFFPPMTGG